MLVSMVEVLIEVGTELLQLIDVEQAQITLGSLV